MKLESKFRADEPARFQTRGALFALDEATELLQFVSDNAGSFYGRSVSQNLLGQSIQEIFGKEITHSLRNAATMRSLNYRRHSIGQFHLSGHLCEILAYRIGTTLVLEALPCSSERDPSAYDVRKDVEVLTDALLDLESLEGSLRKFVALLRTMSGYHCVCLEIAADRELTLVALSGSPNMSGAKCQGQNQLYTLHDLNAPSAGLIGIAGERASFLDISELKFPGSEEVSSCNDAGVASYASLRLKWKGRLQGNLKFLHERPRMPNKRTQFALSHLAPLVGQRLSDLK